MMDNPLYDNGYDDDISYEELLEEVYMLREKVASLEGLNIILQNKVNESQRLKTQLETALMTTPENEEQNKTKKTYIKKEPTAEMKAIQLYYTSNKNNKDVLNNIKTKMIEMGYNVTTLKDIPTKLVKMECLKKFNSLSKEEQQTYFTS